ARRKPEPSSSQTQSGDVSERRDVQRLQQALADMGYYAGVANGMMSSDTMQAVRGFQWWNNLPVTGTLDRKTQTAIESQWSGSFKNTPLSQNYGSENELSAREKPAVTYEQSGVVEEQRTSGPAASTATTSEPQSAGTTVNKDRKKDSDNDRSSAKDYSHRVGKAT